MSAITLIQGHPDPGGQHLCHAMAAAYSAGAKDAGHTVRAIDVARIDFPLIRSKAEFEDGELPPVIRDAQRRIGEGQHLVVIYPLWLGTMPALLKGFLEQVFRYGFAFEPTEKGMFRKKLKGRSARIIVTMGMPALAYRWYFGAHSVRNLERNILRFSGFRPVRRSLFGMAEKAGDAKRRQWLDELARLGSAAR